MANRNARLAQAFAQEIVESKDYRDSLTSRIKSGALPAQLEAMLWHYAYGKPKETVEVLVNEHAIEQELNDLSEEQLAARAQEIAVEIATMARQRTEIEKELHLEVSDPKNGKVH